MNSTKSYPQTVGSRAFARAVSLLCRVGKPARPFVLGGAAFLGLMTQTRAGLISSVTEGPANAPYSYNLTVEFPNRNYYDFTLRSTQASLSGVNFINTVASLTPGMSVDQTYYASFNAYVLNGITIGGDTASGFTNNNYWAYWDGTATNPVQWSSDPTGESGRTVMPGQADGWVYSDGSNMPQATSFAVPEPGTWTLLGGSAAGLALARAGRRRRSREGTRAWAEAA